MSKTVEERLSEHGQALPVAPAAVGFYVPVTQVGNFVVTSGQLPMIGKELTFKGKVGHDLTVEEGYHAARVCALNAIAQIKACIGDLSRVTKIFRVEGYVQSAEGFTGQPQVINGASELLVQAFGETGKHTRIAVGTNELPLNAAVELVVWAEVN
jgi:enamine deaminase RidA (YjgF/YER057c/UK114 family)